MRWRSRQGQRKHGIWVQCRFEQPRDGADRRKRTPIFTISSRPDDASKDRCIGHSASPWPRAWGVPRGRPTSREPYERVPRLRAGGGQDGGRQGARRSRVAKKVGGSREDGSRTILLGRVLERPEKSICPSREPRDAQDHQTPFSRISPFSVTPESRALTFFPFLPLLAPSCPLLHPLAASREPFIGFSRRLRVGFSGNSPAHASPRWVLTRRWRCRHGQAAMRAPGTCIIPGCAEPCRPMQSHAG